MSKNLIDQLASLYNEKKLEKYEYIDKMQAFNKTLFYFSERLKNTDIERIEIEDGMLIFTTKKDNIKLIFNGLDRRAVPFDILNFGHYENEDENVLFSLLEDDSVIFDIGANIGWYSLLFSKRLPHSRIYSFEPIADTYRYLITNITLNNAKNVYPFNIAISENRGSSTFYYFPGGSVLASERNLIHCPKAEETICQVEVLDEFVSNQKIDKVDLIKCDVEGAELFVIKSGINVISKYKPIIFIELFERWSSQFNYHPNDVFRLLQDVGYECFIANGDRLDRCLTYVESEEERLNFFFLHAEKHRSFISQLVVN